jgi:hypothetical protein
MANTYKNSKVKGQKLKAKVKRAKVLTRNLGDAFKD